MIQKSEVAVGRIYAAKRPRISEGGFINDRQVLAFDGVSVQYDSPSIGMGRHYPRVRLDKFLKWADRDVTADVPPHQWRPAFAPTK